MASVAERSEDPRIVRTRSAVVEATIELIHDEGLEAVTFQTVARRAGVGRATLYRHWSGPDELIFEALAEIVSAWEFSGPGRLRDALVSEIDRRRAELNQPVVRIAFNSICARAARDPSAARMRDRLVGSIAGGLKASIVAGTARGELEPGLDAELLTAEVFGAMVWRSFVMGRDVTRGFIEQVVDRALEGWER
ncbi:MAG: TetR/AcrR family transcriptional regulator [Solirubrobacteraceae bacterium]